MSPRLGLIAVAGLLLPLLDAAAARAQVTRAAATTAAATTPWQPRAAEDRRLLVLERLAELEALERLAAGSPAAAPEEEDDAPAEPPSPEEREAAREQLAEEREGRLAALAADPAALVDVLAMNAEAAAHLRPLAFEALAACGEEVELAALLEVAGTLRGQAPFDAFTRLGEVGRRAPEVEARLLALLAGADQHLRGRCLRALARCGGEPTVGALLPTLLRGPLDQALDALEVLDATARRAGDVVARPLVEALDRPPGRGEAPLDEARRTLGHQLLQAAAASAATPYLLAWIDRAVVEGRPAAGRAGRPLATALAALGAVGDEDGVALLLRLEGEGAQDLRQAALAALALVPAAREAEREWVLAELVERLDVAEQAREPVAVRQAYVTALRRLTGAPVGASAAAWRDHLARQRAAAGTPDD